MNIVGWILLIILFLGANYMMTRMAVADGIKDAWRDRDRDRAKTGGAGTPPAAKPGADTPPPAMTGL